MDINLYLRAPFLVSFCLDRILSFLYTVKKMPLTIEEFDINKLRAGLGKPLNKMRIINFYYGNDHCRVPNIRAYGGMKVVKGKFG